MTALHAAIAARDATQRQLTELAETIHELAVIEAAQLNKLHPDVYEMALCLENDGAFYRECIRPAVKANTPAAWRCAGRRGAWYYAGQYAAARQPHTWDAPPGAAELLAAYFQTVKYAELIEDVKKGEVIL